jgi:hypothetical protein
MSFQQWNGSRNILTLNGMDVTEINATTITFSDDTEQTSAYIAANQTPNFWGVQKLSLENIPVNIYGSCKDLGLLGGQNQTDDAWIVFPKWSAVLYQNTNYSGLSSQVINNTTNFPKCWANAPRVDNEYLLADPIVDSTGDENYEPNTTQSIKVYYNGVEQTIAGLS